MRATLPGMTTNAHTHTRVEARILLAEAGRLRCGGEAFDDAPQPDVDGEISTAELLAISEMRLTAARAEIVRLTGIIEGFSGLDSPARERDLGASPGDILAVKASEVERLDPARDAAEIAAARKSDSDHRARARAIDRDDLIADVRKAVRYAGGRTRVEITIARSRRPWPATTLCGRGSPRSVGELAWDASSKTVTGPWLVSELRAWLQQIDLADSGGAA